MCVLGLRFSQRAPSPHVTAIECSKWRPASSPLPALLTVTVPAPMRADPCPFQELRCHNHLCPVSSPPPPLPHHLSSLCHPHEKEKAAEPSITLELLSFTREIEKQFHFLSLLFSLLSSTSFFNKKDTHTHTHENIIKNEKLNILPHLEMTTLYT